MRTQLATLIGSRICHDLISPIGAIGNGVELLGLTGSSDDNSPELDLISQSVENANAKIRYFRIAFGSTSTKQFLGRQEVLSVLAASAKGGRFSYFWQIESDQPRSEVQIAFLLMQCFETALPMGGNIHVRLNGQQWELKANGPRLAMDPAIWAALTDPQVAMDHTAAQVQFALLPSVLTEVGKTLEISVQDETICARF
uniref:histidine phosphotransferase family protein n=1 Tax=Yoonia sp. TaxID=2212373 RepID=UPI0040472FE1